MIETRSSTSKATFGVLRAAKWVRMAGSAGAIALVEMAVIVLASNSVAVSPRSEVFGAESVMGVVDIIETMARVTS